MDVDEVVRKEGGRRVFGCIVLFPGWLVVVKQKPEKILIISYRTNG